MIIAFDYDGVITANISHYNQLASDFIRSGHEVIIITGASYKRAKRIQETLQFPYTRFIGRPKNFKSTPFNIGTWKKIQLLKNNVGLWFDNEIKVYEQAGVTFNDIETQLVRI